MKERQDSLRSRISAALERIGLLPEDRETRDVFIQLVHGFVKRDDYSLNEKYSRLIPINILQNIAILQISFAFNNDEVASCVSGRTDDLDRRMRIREQEITILASAYADDVPAEIQRAAELLGGSTVLGHPLCEWSDVHEVLLRGLPGAALGHLANGLIATKSWTIAEALGMSRRTLQRRLNTPEKVLRREQGDRLWAFAYIVAKATSAFGSQERAENWMATPCASVRGLRPVDLLGSPVGIDIVEYLLERTG